jgi:hypothetical protein
MPSVARVLPVDQTLYSKAELFEHRRKILRSARSFPPGSKRNHHRQVAACFARCSRTRNGSPQILLRVLAVSMTDHMTFVRVCLGGLKSLNQIQLPLF